jgi:hypothetical protein
MEEVLIEAVGLIVARDWQALSLLLLQEVCWIIKSRIDRFESRYIYESMPCPFVGVSLSLGPIISSSVDEMVSTAVALWCL